MDKEYEELIEIAIEKEINTMSAPVALRQARKVPDIEIDDEGKIKSINAPGKKVFEELLEKFQDATGPVATAIIAKAIKDEKGEDLEVEIPEELKDKM